MKIALAQLNFHIGNIDSNKGKILLAIEQAEGLGVDMVIFPELAICGYPPDDLLNFNSFIEKCRNAIEEIAEKSHGVAVIIGSPEYNPGKGKSLYNSAFFLNDGKIEKIIHKGLLPTYDVFDERRYFEPPKTFQSIKFKDKVFALTICEDLWTNSELYSVCPMEELNKQKPDVIISIAASPFSYQHEEKRKTVLTGNVIGYKIPVLYVNHVGANTELVFDGNSLFMDSEGKIIAEAKSFEEDILILNVFDKTNAITTVPIKSKIEKIHDALVLGVKDYFLKMGFKKAILGLSGGIDSAIVAVLAEKALGKENVFAVLLPSQFSSDHSINDALLLSNNLGIKNHQISISEIYDLTLERLSPVFNNAPFDITEENLQARIRGLLLMAISNKQGYILLNTTNKSEMAVGYGTLYGDLCGGLSVLGDVYKTEVYELANYINRNKEIIPANTLNKPASAELRPNQKDSDSLPDYMTLDKILYHYIEGENGKEEIVNKGFDKGLVERILTLVNKNEFKRYQTAPVLRVSPKAFGRGRRMPIVAKYDI